MATRNIIEIARENAHYITRKHMQGRGGDLVVARTLTTMADEIERLCQALTLARDKLRLYREAHGGEYVGGAEYTALMAQIDDCLK